MATSRVKLAKAAWARLTGQRCKNKICHDVAPASDDHELDGSYKVENKAVTSEGFPFVLRAVYTIAAGSSGNTKSAAAGEEPPLINAAPRIDCPSHVKKLFDGHVRALAAVATTEQLSKGAMGFVEQVMARAQVDLGKAGLCILSATVQKLSVVVPAERLEVAVVAKEGNAPATALVQSVASQHKELHLLGNDGLMDAVHVQAAATTKLQVHVEVQEGKKVVRLIVKILPDQLSQSSVANGTQVKEESNKEAALSAATEDRAEYVATKMEELAGDLRAFTAFDGERIKDAAEHMESLAEGLKAAAALLGRKTGAAQQVASVSKALPAAMQEKTDAVATAPEVSELPAESNAN